ncbi:YbaB/EbfC family nucleoid-associated protein [Sphingomicrobium sp. XHP0235]|uniref:YbaB/EbfC family nucleoid-associated protein n=1 Tax=Sphingomicrobium aquimarinum TaxID=3133971 RepID=UPI0031FE4FE0
MPDMNAIMEMARKAQEDLANAQANLDKIEVEGSSGGGMVKIRASAKGRIIRVEIDDSLMKPDDKGMLEDLVAAAFNDAKMKADQAAAEEMQKATGGLQMPPGFQMP